MTEYRNHNSREVLKSKFYSRHISAMTGEDLHSKAEIAEELAVRDMQIEDIKAKWNYYQNFVKSHGADSITQLVVQRDQLRKRFGTYA